MPPRPRVGACLVSLALPDQRRSRPSAAHGHHNERAAHGGHPGGPGRDALRCRGWAGFDSLCLHDDGVFHDIDCIDNDVSYNDHSDVSYDGLCYDGACYNNARLTASTTTCATDDVCYDNAMLTAFRTTSATTTTTTTTTTRTAVPLNFTSAGGAGYAMPKFSHCRKRHERHGQTQGSRDCEIHTRRLSEREAQRQRWAEQGRERERGHGRGSITGTITAT